MHCLSGYLSCLCPHFSTATTLSALCNRISAATVCGASLWVGHSFQSLYESSVSKVGRNRNFNNMVIKAFKDILAHSCMQNNVSKCIFLKCLDWMVYYITQLYFNGTEAGSLNCVHYVAYTNFIHALKTPWHPTLDILDTTWSLTQGFYNSWAVRQQNGPTL